MKQAIILPAVQLRGYGDSHVSQSWLFLNNRFWNLSWSWLWCIICSNNYQITCVLAHDWKYVMVYVIHGQSRARPLFPGYFFLRYSSYYWVPNFCYGSFRQFFIISDLIFIINVVYNITCEYIVPLFPFSFALLIIDCGTHCDNISNIIIAFISVFQSCTVMLYCDAVSYSGGILAFFRVVSDTKSVDWILTFPIFLQ